MKSFYKYLGLLVIMMFLLSACQQAPAAAPATDGEPAKTRVAMVLPGLKTDEAFNQYTYEGMVRAAGEFDLEYAFREEVKQDEQIEILRQFAQQGYDIIIGQGGQFGEALQTVAKEFPNQKFIFSVATDTGGVPNLTAATVSYSHAGYIGGVMACNMTKNNKVAMITGEWYDPHRQMEASFIKGAQTCGKEVEVTSVATGSWSDVNKAREASLALIANGFDVLYPCLDSAFVGVLTAAQDSKDVLVVGAVIDMAPIAPDVTVGSTVFNWNELGYQEAAGMLVDGKSHILGLAENGISIVTNDLLSVKGKADVEAAIQSIMDGKVDIAP